MYYIYYPWRALCFKVCPINMDDLKEYLKYYPSELERYLFEDINKKFKTGHHLNSDDFFTIIAWKRKASAIKIAKKWKGLAVENVTENIFKESDDNKKVEILIGIGGIGLAIASSILAVCYPDRFTIIDYRALNSLRKIEKDRCKDLPDKAENFKKENYFEYLDICQRIWKKYASSLRDFDKMLWAMDWAVGEKGVLSEVVETYKERLKR